MGQENDNCNTVQPSDHGISHESGQSGACQINATLSPVLASLIFCNCFLCAVLLLSCIDLAWIMIRAGAK